MIHDPGEFRDDNAEVLGTLRNFNSKKFLDGAQ